MRKKYIYIHTVKLTVRNIKSQGNDKEVDSSMRRNVKRWRRKTKNIYIFFLIGRSYKNCMNVRYKIKEGKARNHDNRIITEKKAQKGIHFNLHLSLSVFLGDLMSRV